MVRNFRHEIKLLLKVLGPKVSKIGLFSILLGLLWSSVEGFFALVLQGFFASIKLINADKALLPSWYPKDVYTCLFLLVFSGFLKGLLIFFKNLIRNSTLNLFLKEQRKYFFQYVMNAPPKDSTQKISHFFSETIPKSSSYVSGLAVSLVSLVTGGLILLMCVYLSWKYFVVCLLVLLVFYFPQKLMSSSVETLGKAAKLSMSNTWGEVLQSFRNFYFLKLTQMTSNSVTIVSNHLDDYYLTNQRFSKLSAYRTALPHIAGVTVVAALTMIFYNDRFFDPAVLLSFIYLFSRFAVVLSDIQNNSMILKFNKSHFLELIEMHKRYSSYRLIDKNNIAVKFESSNLKLTFKNIYFSYESDIGSKMFEDLNFQILTNETILIKGESGVGKSTLLGIILGVIPPSSGTICMNDVIVSELLPQISPMIGYVGPDPCLISGTVRENLLYGLSDEFRKNVTEEDLIQSLKYSMAYEFVLSLPKGLDEYLNEHVQLSTGQKQRIAIARALVRKPQILVLDEATANVDLKTEYNIIQSVLKLKKLDLGLIVVSHRNSFDKFSDRIFLLQKSEKQNVTLSVMGNE
jgi:ABC-type multidrug transport system fused ATPase/permease subunit